MAITVGPKSFIKYSILVILAGSITINTAFVAIYYQDIKDWARPVAKGVLIRLNLHPKPHLKLDTYNNKPLGDYHYLGNVETIHGSNTTLEAIELPETLIIPPGRYKVNGKLYDCENEGLYRFVYPFKNNQQRIVYKRTLLAILSGIAWIASHGNSDNSKSLDQLTSEALKSKLSINCGPISSWANYLLNDVGVKSRKVGALTLEEWNSYDNGHAMIEVYRGKHGGWELYDLDNNGYFTHNGSMLSLIDFVKCVNLGEYEINDIANDIRLDVSGMKHKMSGYDFALFSESAVFAESGGGKLRKWYKRVIQVPRIWEDGYAYFTFVDKSDLSWKIDRVESYSDRFRYLDYADFMKKFY